MADDFVNTDVLLLEYIFNVSCEKMFVSFNRFAWTQTTFFSALAKNLSTLPFHHHTKSINKP